MGLFDSLGQVELAQQHSVTDLVTVQLVPILTAEGAEIAEIQIAFRLVCLA
jgi:hypothetical protein